MTTQPTEAVGSETNAPDANPFEAIADDMLGQGAEHEEEEELPAETEGEEPEVAEDETEAEEEADDLPPIEAPVSWDAEAKAVFATLPREAQEIVQKREAERERFVQQKSQEAARAKTEVEQAAYQQLAQYDAQVSQQLQGLVEQLQPQRPNPQLLQYDPQAFYAQQAQYEADVAQRQELQRRAEEHAQQAKAREAYAEQAYHAEQHRIIVENFPEYTEPTTGPKLQAELSAVARELGYPPELISQARADDILAMRKVAELKAKADKYDALNAKKMEKVRAAKGLPRVATPGVPQGNEQLRANRANAAWESAKTAKSRNAKDEALAQWMTDTGWL
jgi:hypothetical protein